MRNTVEGDGVEESRILGLTALCSFPPPQMMNSLDFPQKCSLARVGCTNLEPDLRTYKQNEVL